MMQKASIVVEIVNNDYDIEIFATRFEKLRIILEDIIAKRGKNNKKKYKICKTIQREFLYPLITVSSNLYLCHNEN